MPSTTPVTLRELDVLLHEKYRAQTLDFTMGDYLHADFNLNGVPWYRCLPSIDVLNQSTVFNLDPKFPKPRNYDEREAAFTRLWSNTGRDHRRKIYGVFTVGNSWVVGFLRTDGVMQFCRFGLKILAACLSDAEEGDAREALWKRVLGVFDKMFEYSTKITEAYYSDGDEVGLEREDLKVTLMTKILQSIQSGNQFLTPESLEEMLDKTLGQIFGNHAINSLSKRFLFSVNSTYRTTITTMWRQHSSLSEEAFKRGLNVGTHLFGGLVLAGYIPDPTSKLLVKEVGIVPQVCMKNNNYYTIHEKDRKFKVTRIKFDPSSVTSKKSLVLMTEETHHPNVNSGGQICIGDESTKMYNVLITKRQTQPEELAELLSKIEESLHIINYDSPHFGMSDGMSARLKPLEVAPELLGNVKRNFKKGTDVRRV